MQLLHRSRRLRTTPVLRELVRETRCSKSSLIYPLFIQEGHNIQAEIPAMPGQFRYSPDRLPFALEQLAKLGIRSVLLFGIPLHKDPQAYSAYAENGVIQTALQTAKQAFPQFCYITDVCLCEYTSHGHCGLICDGEVLNDETLPFLAKASVVYAKAGADIIAPSDMMDKRVEAIRKALDEEGLYNTPIMSYSAKFASAYYGPFRDAAHSAPGFGDRKSYQMDPANGEEALREVEQDIKEGADLIIAKPAMAYLDVLKDISIHYNIPIVAYNVSGEYAMVKAAAQKGWIDEKRIVMEHMIGFKRAGAKMIITYHALDVARWLKEEQKEQ